MILRVFCCQQSTANDDLPCDVSVVVQRYSWRVDCVYLLHMSPLLRSFSTMDLRVSWIGQLDFELWPCWCTVGQTARQCMPGIDMTPDLHEL